MPFVCTVEDGVMVVRAIGVVKLEDVTALAEDVERYFALPGCERLFLGDHSELKVIAPEAAAAIIARMRADNPRILRSAFIIGEGTSALQLSRILRDAGSDKRRTFTNADQALAWLLSSSPS
jgi:hypothetical protein